MTTFGMAWGEQRMAEMNREWGFFRTLLSIMVDPLNHLLIELLQRYRSGTTERRVERSIYLTINGVAAGLRNSG